jgi:hypothetical protein
MTFDGPGAMQRAEDQFERLKIVCGIVEIAWLRWDGAEWVRESRIRRNDKAWAGSDN